MANLMNTSQHPAPARMASLDAYRGFVMFLMMAEVLHLSRMSAAFPQSFFWEFLAHHQSHVEWAGCSLHDLIQPSFSFLVGVALPFSIANRLARGQSRGLMILHAAWRALVLTALGVFLRSVGRSQTYFTFEDTLSQIGLGYLPLFVLGLAACGEGRQSISAKDAIPFFQERSNWCWVVLGIILMGYWAAFALYPRPGDDFDYASVGVPSDWPYLYSGFAAHWNKNSNLAWAFDTWFLNLFRHEKPFTHNGGGYATLSFIPTLGTMILGLIAGDWLQSKASASKKLGRLALAGLLCLAVGFLADSLGVCPSVKRIWTPAWTLFSGGWCFLILAGFYATLDVSGFPGWAFPLRVIGMNSIAAYCIAHLIGGFIISSFKTHLGQHIFEVYDSESAPLVQGTAVLAVYWLILFWMYRRRIFLRI
jgi:heparan-alpha-glucosaminide N-acetyltransferase